MRPRTAYLRKRLRRRYGVLGIVAGRYLEAGYSVELGHKTSKSLIDIVARKEGGALAITVVSGPSRITGSLVREAAEKAGLIRARPILVLYGRGHRIEEDALEEARKLGVVFRRIRSA
jgi:predicted RecB family endonuclease